MAIRDSAGDPRVAASASGEASVRPVVALPRKGLPGWAIGVGALVAGVLLFTMLEARRRAPSAPAVKARASDLAGMPPPPPLYVPPEIAVPIVMPEIAPPLPAPAAPPPQPRIVYVPQPYPVPTAAPVQEAPPPPPRVTNDPTLVFDSGAAPAAAATAAAAEGEGAAAAPAGVATLASRTRAGVLANRTTTVAQGTLIPAVLETALDSTRPGFARAIVSRDVRGFDGRRVLIPRGSRLIGEYRSEAAPGQRRALVIWTRLIRPDGVTIAIASPAGDPLGRGGIRARVNSHFFERFAGAILQSGLDIGVNLASRASSGTVVVVPGTGVVQSGVGQLVQPSQVVPTLTVRQGTSISIFVARDLDFTGVENRR
jgi:type IV secretion system protein VirB10